VIPFPNRLGDYFFLVIPAKAGIQKFDERSWGLAFAGTTEY
jgi:hypothetical protein